MNVLRRLDIPSFCYRVGLVLFTFLLNMSGSVNALEYEFDRAKSANSLSHLSVQCLAKDSAGFIWLGTKDGLNRYDGYQFVSYKYNPKSKNSISNNEISCLTVQGDSLLWIGTRGGGVNRLNLKNGFIKRYSYETFNGFIRDICIDSSGIIWVATSVGLLKNDLLKDEFNNVSTGAVFRRANNESFIPSELNIEVEKIYAYQSNQLVISASNGVFMFDADAGFFRVISSETRYLSISTDIFEDNSGSLWIANYDGLYKLEPKIEDKNRFNFFQYYSGGSNSNKIKPVRVDAAAIDQHENVWFSIESIGLAMLSGDSILYNTELVAGNEIAKVNTINALLYDEKGILWIGSDDSGLYFVDLSTNPFRKLNKGLDREGAQIKNAKSITGRENKVLVGNLTGEIELFNLSNNKVQYKKSIPLIYENQVWSKLIRALLIDKGDNIWVGSTFNSLIRYSADGNAISYNTAGYVFSIMEDSQNNIWYGTWGSGFGYINSKTGHQESYSITSKKMLALSNDVILSMKEVSGGYLLIGTKGGGLNIAPIENVIKKEGVFDVYEHNPEKPYSIAHDDIYKILETKEGDIWVGTGRGLVKLIPESGKSLNESLSDGTIQFDEITEKDGLPGGIVTSINEDHNGYLWLATNGGVCRYSEKDGSVINFKPEGEDLVESYENNAVYFNEQSRVMFLGGRNGVLYFNPDSVIQKGVSYSVYFTGFSILNERIKPGKKYNGRLILEKDIAYTDEIKLKYSDKLISFEFSCLNNSVKEGIRYKYQLLGFNDSWLEVSNRERRITFSSLKPGKYILQVKASNADGSWSDKITEINIEVKPPLWLTPWAFGAYLVFVLFLLLTYRRYSIKRLQDKNQLHIQELEHRKEVEISEAKIRFFTNVSHEIRTPLTLIYEPLRQLSSHKRLPEGARDLTDMMMRNMKRLLNQVNRLLELRKLDGGEYVINYSNILVRQIITRIMYEFEAGVKSKGVEVRYNIPDNVELKADRQLLDTVLYNLISNAIKFLPNQNGLLEFHVAAHQQDKSIKKGDVRISISDNGPGIPDDELKSIFDYFYQSTRVVQSNIGGTGIGLAIVKEYVDYHQGSVTVENLKRGGCRFNITLPINLKQGDILLSDDELKTEIDTADSTSLTKYLEQVTKGNVLNMVIVEDDVDLANYLKRVFKGKFKVTNFAEGQSALEQMSEIMPDIIITDLMMPKLNGMALTEKLKTNTETSHIPIIMLTAKSEDESMIKGFKHGADSYLTKPFNTEVLVAQVGAIIKSRAAFKERFSANLVLEPSESVIVPAEEKFIKKILELTESRLDDHTFEVPDIVNEMGMSHSLVLKKFKAVTGMSLVEFVRSMRIKKAQQLFKQDKFTVAEVAYKVGFSDPKYFSKCFANEVGERPSVYIKKYHV